MSAAEIKLTANERRKADREAAVAASFREIWPVVQAAGYKPNRALDEVAERHELTRAGVVGILRRLGIYKSAKQIILN
jgi:hypothetical protein